MDEWTTLAPEHKWVYDKLLVSTVAGCNCGPMGIAVPHIGNYIVKPITNLAGMGVGSIVYTNASDTLPYQAGYFWVELLIGSHLSVDYQYGCPTLVLRGDHDPQTTTKFTRWTRMPLSDAPILPQALHEVCKHYAHFNAEFIGGTVIEVHCRVGGDSWIFDDPTVDIIIPVWEDDASVIGTDFVPSYEDAPVPRLGFNIVRTLGATDDRHE